MPLQNSDGLLHLLCQKGVFLFVQHRWSKLAFSPSYDFYFIFFLNRFQTEHVEWIYLIEHETFGNGLNFQIINLTDVVSRYRGSTFVTDCFLLTLQSDEEFTGQHFGVRVCHLIGDKNPVPVVLEMMLEHVEMHGLYTEGIYRKSGSANRIKELHQRLETG